MSDERDDGIAFVILPTAEQCARWALDFGGARLVSGYFGAEMIAHPMSNDGSALYEDPTELTQAENAFLRAMAAEARAQMAEGEPETVDKATQRNPVDVVIDQLQKRAVAPADRCRLGDALDKANAPDTSRAGSDAAVGKAIR